MRALGLFLEPSRGKRTEEAGASVSLHVGRRLQKISARQKQASTHGEASWLHVHRIFRSPPIGDASRTPLCCAYLHWVLPPLLELACWCAARLPWPLGPIRQARVRGTTHSALAQTRMPCLEYLAVRKAELEYVPCSTVTQALPCGKGQQQPHGKSSINPRPHLDHLRDAFPCRSLHSMPAQPTPALSGSRRIVLLSLSP